MFSNAFISAVMQGEETATSIIAALDAIATYGFFSMRW